MSKLIMEANPILFINDEESKMIHEENNKIIKELIDNFMTTNNLDYEDFIVCGSSCASYMDYFMLKKVHDIDIYMINKDKKVEFNSNTDNIWRLNCSPDFVKNVDIKDNYQFLSKIDLILSMSIAGLHKLKKRDMIYAALLMRDLGMTVEECIEHITDILPETPGLTEHDRENIASNIPFLRLFVNERFKEIDMRCKKYLDKNI